MPIINETFELAKRFLSHLLDIQISCLCDNCSSIQTNDL